MARLRSLGALDADSSVAVLQDITNTSKRLSSNGSKKSNRKSASLDADKVRSEGPRPARASGRADRIVPAKKVHRPPRMTRKPLRTQDDNKERKSSGLTGVETAREAQRRSSRSDTAHAHATSFSDDSLDEDTNTPNPRVSTSAQPSASKASGMERTMLVLKNFKRRSRQPSMLTMVSQRLASARSSLAPEVNLASDPDDSFDLEEDFLPDATGTPMYGGYDSMGMRGMTRRETPSLGKRKRTSDDAHPDEINEILSKHYKLVSQSDEEQDTSEQDDVDPFRIESTPELASNHDDSLHIDTLLASPLSVSSPPEYTSMGPRSIQQTPAGRQTRGTGRKAPMSTAELQRFLPKRRFPNRPIQSLNLRQHDREDSPDENDSPEYVNTKQTSKAVRTAQKHTSKTYGRDKAMHEDHAEADQGDAGTSTFEEVANSDELEAARKKFAEVDKWELEFEDLNAEDSRSSQTWR